MCDCILILVKEGWAEPILDLVNARPDTWFGVSFFEGAAMIIKHRFAKHVSGLGFKT